MDVDKIRCILWVWSYLLPIIIFLSIILVYLVKEMVKDGEDSYYWTIDSDTNINDNLF